MKVRVKVPKKILDAEGVREEIARTLQYTVALDAKAFFRKTTYGWTNKPRWSQAFDENADMMSETIAAEGPNADQYSLVNNGVNPHIIRPINPRGFLRFQPGYRASTTPGSLDSRRNYRSGQAIMKKIVYHPGLEARDFDVLIAHTYAANYQDEIQGAINRAVRAQHGRWSGTY